VPTFLLILVSPVCTAYPVPEDPLVVSALGFDNYVAAKLGADAADRMEKAIVGAAHGAGVLGFLRQCDDAKDLEKLTASMKEIKLQNRWKKGASCTN
jgi:hypothetical protein